MRSSHAPAGSWGIAGRVRRDTPGTANRSHSSAKPRPFGSHPGRNTRPALLELPAATDAERTPPRTGLARPDRDAADSPRSFHTSDFELPKRRAGLAPARCDVPELSHRARAARAR